MNLQSGIVFRLAPLSEIFELRWTELRPGYPRSAAEFDGDCSPDAFHFGAFDAQGENIGCATFQPNAWEGERAHQLRGMASRADRVRQGVGRGLLLFAESVLIPAGVTLLWCNARSHAAGFYRKLGWRIASDEFLFPEVGPHYKMIKRLG